MKRGIECVGTVAAAFWFLVPPAQSVLCQVPEKAADNERPNAHKDGPLPYGEFAARARKAAADFAAYHPLSLDHRLLPRLTVDERDAKLPDLLQRLAATTGLKFTLADNLRYHDPDLGDMYPDAGAYSIMELIAEEDIEDGRWVKTEGGYRLEGVSRALRPPPHNFRWLWALIAASVVLAVGGGFAFYRRRRKTITV